MKRIASAGTRSARELRDDVRRYLTGEAVQACPPSAIYRIRKLAAKHRLALGSLGVVVASLAAATALSLWFAVEANRAKTIADERLNSELAVRRTAEKLREDAVLVAQEATHHKHLAEQNEDKLRRRLYGAHLGMASAAWDNGRSLFATQLLEKYIPQKGEPDLRSFEWHYLWDRFHPELYVIPCNGSAFSFAFTPDGRQLLVPSRQGSTLVLDSSSGRSLHELIQGDAVSAVAVSGDGHRVGTGDEHGRMILWEASTWTEEFRLEGPSVYVHSISFSPQANRVAVSYGPYFGNRGPHEVKLWGLATRQATSLEQGNRVVHSLAFSPDGKELAGSTSHQFFRWDVASGELNDTVPQEGAVHQVAYLPEGDSIIAGGSHGVSIWDRKSKQRIRQFGKHLFAMSIGPNSQPLATAGRAGEVHLWDVSTGKQVGKKIGSKNWIWALAWSPDGEVLQWNTSTGAVERRFEFTFDLGC